MLVVRISADQPYSAERRAALGLARAIGPDERPPAAIRDAVREVLTEPGYRARARADQAEMEALPGRDRMVEMLEGLARKPTSAHP
jgi:UDP:flavonoid glycosyltransferase YjiC (YdhE family)